MKTSDVAILAGVGLVAFYFLNKGLTKQDEKTERTGIKQDEKTERTGIKQDEKTERTGIKQDEKTERTGIRWDSLVEIFKLLNSGNSSTNVDDKSVKSSSKSSSENTISQASSLRLINPQQPSVIEGLKQAQNKLAEGRMSSATPVSSSINQATPKKSSRLRTELTNVLKVNPVVSSTKTITSLFSKL